MDKRLMTLLQSGVKLRGGVMIDTYNQQVHYDVACTIRTNINTANHHFIVDMETDNTITSVQKDSMVAEPTIIKEGNYSPSGHNASSIVKDRCVQIGNIYPDSENMANRSGGRVYSTTGCAPTILSRDFKQPKMIMEEALRATDYKAPHCVYEPNVMAPKRTEFGKAVRKQYESGELNMSRHDMTTMEPRTDGITNTLTSVQKDNWLAEPQGDVEYEERGGNEVVEHRYRIRKLTPRECFRLMGVDDADIDKLLAANISNTQLYRCAGNSIVVDVLYHIFRKCFCQKQNEHQQQTLF